MARGASYTAAPGVDSCCAKARPGEWPGRDTRSAATPGGRTFVSAEGHLWELAPWMPGKPRDPEAATAQHVAAAMAMLAQFHAATAILTETARGAETAPAVAERLARIERWLHQGTAELMERESARAEPLLAKRARPLMAAFRQWVSRVETELRAAQKLSLPLQPCIRDVHDQHVLFLEDERGRPRVSGLIDFGAMRVDTVATDIARLLGSLARDDAALWEAGLAAYQQQRPLSDGERQLTRLIDRSNVVLTGPQWLQWLLLEHKQFDALPAILSRLDRVLNRLKNLEANSAVERRN